MPSLSSHEGGGAWPGGVGGIPPGLFCKTSVFGDGTYSQNVMQGGSVLQPGDAYINTTSTITGIAQSNFNAHGGCTLANLTNGVTAAAVGCDTVDDATAALLNIGWAGNATRISRLRFYSYAGTERLKGFYLEKALPGGSFVQLPIKAVVEGGILNGINGQANNADGWVTVDFDEITTANVRIVFTSRWGIGDNYAYLTEIETYLKVTNCIYITGIATVAPDAETGACVLTCDTLVLDGATARLTASTKNKGLLIFAKTRIHVGGGGQIKNGWDGKAGNFGNVLGYDLVPTTLRRKLRRTAYTAIGEGALGGAAVSSSGGVYLDGLPGAAAAAMQAGGGGSGAACTNLGTPAVSGAGGKAGPCAGGAGGGATATNSTGYVNTPAGDYGGPGGPGYSDLSSFGAGGGAGDPVGANGLYGTGAAPGGSGGGLLMLFTPLLTIFAGCYVSADGGPGGYQNSGISYCWGGGGAGGGIVCIVTLPGGYANSGTVRANGGLGGPAYGASGRKGGDGGAGSVNIFTV